ncbi:MAG: polysaccharide biosynthesis tyrosine autokinase, partial [Thermoguttaceae bacterium]|nr:polysaccharide biosynthesis tyrosine autokinase [Thermoguttaceae bacterium]
ERDLNFFDVLGILRRQIWIVILVTIVGGALAVYKYTVTPKEYQSSVEIYFPSASASALLRSYDQMSAANNQTKIDSIETLSTVIVSDVILEPVSDALLGKYRQDAPRFGESFNLRVAASARLVAESKGAAPATQENKTSEQTETVVAEAQEDKRDSSAEAKEERRKKAIAIGMLRKMLSVKKGGNGRDFEDANVISVSCVTLDPEEAQLIVQIVVDEFKKYFNATYNNKSEFVRKEIEKHQAALHVEIEQKTRELLDLVSAANITHLGNEENNPLLARLIGMSEGQVAIDLEIMKWNTRLTSLEDALAGRDIRDVPTHEIISMLGASDNDTVLTQMLNTARGSQDTETLSAGMMATTARQRAEEEVAKVKAELSAEGLKYADSHPKIIELEKRLALSEEHLATTMENISDVGSIGTINYPEFFEGYVNAVRQKINELSELQMKTEEYMHSYDAEVRKMNEYREELAAKRVALESLKTMHQNFGQSLESLALVSNVDEHELRIAEPSLNYVAVYPNLIKFAFVGFALGFIAGFALAYLVDVCDATFRSPSEIVRTLRVPILTQLPSFKSALKDATPKKKKEAREARQPDPELLAYYKPNAPACEVFRQIRTRLFNQPSTGRGRVVLNTSPHPSDGKTMFFSNLAVKIAEMGKSVVLCDGDLRKPDVHKWFGLENKEGVSNVLSGDATLESVLRTTPVKNLTVVTAGTRRKNPAELVAGAEFDALLEELRSKFDVVLIDSPPTLYVSDAASMATRVDGVTYVFRVRRRGRPDVVAGIKSLAEVGANILGCVVNCYDKHRFYNEFAEEEQSGDYGYGYGYGGGYGYGYGGGYGYGYGAGYGAGYGYGEGYEDEESGDSKDSAAG